jgi:hypothetical protein
MPDFALREDWSAVRNNDARKKKTDHLNESKRKKKEWKKQKQKRRERERGRVRKVGRPFFVPFES